MSSKVNGRTVVKVFATTGMEAMRNAVESELRTRLSGELDHFVVEGGQHSVSTFSNQNMEVQVDNVRDHVVVVLHTQTPPVSDHIVELLALLDAINNAHPRQTFVVFPYMPYSRSDRKNRPRISVMGQRLPEILNKVLNVRRVLLLEPHDPHIKQYFVPTADEVPGLPMLVEYIRREYLSQHKPEDCTVVFADSSAAKRFEEVPSSLGIEPAYIYKSRTDHSENPHVKVVMGNVKGKHCLLVDDEILTGNTVLKDAAILKQEGASTVRMLAVHGVLLDQKLTAEQLIGKLANSVVDEFVVTDSIPIGDKLDYAEGKIKVISIAPLLGEACKRLILGESLSALHRIEGELTS